MKLLTKDIKKKLSKTPIGSTAEKNAEDIPIIVKFFGGGSYSAYVYEGDELDGMRIIRIALNGVTLCPLPTRVPAARP